MAKLKITDIVKDLPKLNDKLDQLEMHDKDILELKRQIERLVKAVFG